MRFTIIMMMFILYGSINAMPVYWKDFGLSHGGGFDGTVAYWFSGSVYGANGENAWIHTMINGHEEHGGLYLKQFDFSKEMMEPTFNWWALVLYGDIVSESTFASLQPIELFDYDGHADSGGTLIETPEDFYMAFKVSEVLKGSTGYTEGMSWYGWVHVSVDDNLQMTLLGADINLYGGEIIVGASTPEPSGGMLLLWGVAVLGLRRRRGQNLI